MVPSSWQRQYAAGSPRLVPKPRSSSPAPPGENGYVESFNARLRDELLNDEIFYSLKEAQVVIEQWRRHYNTIRSHSSLGYRPPAPETTVPPIWPPGSATLRRPSSLAAKPNMH